MILRQVKNPSVEKEGNRIMGRIIIPSGKAFNAESKPGYGKYKDMRKGENFQVSMEDIASGFQFAESLYTSPLLRDVAGGAVALFDPDTYKGKDDPKLAQAAVKRAEAKRPSLSEAITEQLRKRNAAAGIDTEAPTAPAAAAPAPAPAAPTVTVPAPAAEDPSTLKDYFGEETGPPGYATLKLQLDNIEGQRDKLDTATALYRDPQGHKIPPETLPKIAEIIREGQASIKQDMEAMATEITEIINDPQHPQRDAIVQDEAFIRMLQNPDVQPRSAKEAVYKLVAGGLLTNTSEGQPDPNHRAAAPGPSPDAPGPPSPTPEPALPNDIDQLIQMLRSTGATPKEIGVIQWHKRTGKIPAGIQKAKELLAQYSAAPVAPAAAPTPAVREPAPLVTPDSRMQLGGEALRTGQEAIPKAREFAMQVSKMLTARGVPSEQHESVIRSLQEIGYGAASKAAPAKLDVSRYRIPRGSSIGAAQAIVAGLARAGGTEQDLITIINEDIGNITGVYGGAWGEWLAGARKTKSGVGGYFTSPHVTANKLYGTWEAVKTGGPKARKAALGAALQEERYRQMMGGAPSKGSKEAAALRLKQQRLIALERKNYENEFTVETRLAQKELNLANSQAQLANKLKGVVSYVSKSPPTRGKTPTSKVIKAYEAALDKDSKSLNTFTRSYNKILSDKILTINAKVQALKDQPDYNLEDLNSDEIIHLYGTNTAAYGRDKSRAKDKGANRSAVIAELENKSGALSNKHFNLIHVVKEVETVRQNIREVLKVPYQTKDERTEKLATLNNLGEKLIKAENAVTTLLGPQ